MNNLSELRKLLLTSISEIKTGKLDVPKASAMCAMANSVISLTRLEMDYLIRCEFEIPFAQPEEGIESTLREIEENNKKPYTFGQ